MPSRTGTIAFAFDIDGVLVHGKNPVPEARRALAKLEEHDIPFMFLTNSGGVTEAENKERLGKRLSMDLSRYPIVQSHTPFLELVPKYKDQWILALGGVGQAIRQLAKGYGFNKVLLSSDLVKEQSHIHPFPEMTTCVHNAVGQARSDAEREEGIAAIMVFSSPRDWCLDLQVVKDLLLSEKGRLGTVSRLNGDETAHNCGYQQDGQPTLHFSNPDFEWPTAYALPRMAQGSFRAALEGIWHAETGGRAKLQYEQCGKPTAETFRYSESELLHWQRADCQRRGEPVQPIRSVYMVGDNPKSDITGTNAHDESAGVVPWYSVLVETGMHKAGTKPSATPTHCLSDVAAAVDWALAREGYEEEEEKMEETFMDLESDEDVNVSLG